MPMPVSLTLKNIPDEVYARLKSVAETHRRSINNQAIICLETVLTPAQPGIQEKLRQIKDLRTHFQGFVSAGEIDRLKREGRA